MKMKRKKEPNSQQDRKHENNEFITVKKVL